MSSMDCGSLCLGPTGLWDYGKEPPIGYPDHSLPVPLCQCPYDGPRFFA
jgi:hypothetical protein